MPFLRQSYKQKPQQWGPFSAVQSALFHNAEKMGINPTSIALAMPMWERAGDTIRDYGHSSAVGNSYSTHQYFTNHGLFSTGSSGMITLPVDPVLAITGDMTIISRVRNDETDGGGVIIGRGSYRYEYEFQCSTNSGEMVFLMGNTSAYNNPYSSVGANIQKGVFTDLAVGRNVGTKKIRFYQDAKYISELGYTTQAIDSGSNTVLFGREHTASLLNGCIANLFLFRDLLLDEQIADLSDNPYQLWQPVPQKTISLPLGDSPLLLNKINGIAAANISKINKITYSTIESINGVS